MSELEQARGLDEVDDVIHQLLQQAILPSRAAGWNDDAAYRALEADHITVG